MLAVSSSAYWIWKIGSMYNIFWHKQSMMVISLYLELWTTLKGSGHTESHGGVLGLPDIERMPCMWSRLGSPESVSKGTFLRWALWGMWLWTWLGSPVRNFPDGAVWSERSFPSAVFSVFTSFPLLCKGFVISCTTFVSAWNWFLGQLEYCSEILAYAYVLKMCHLCFLLTISGIQGPFVEETVYFSVYFSPFSEIRGCSCMGYFCICSVSLAICLFLCSPVSLSLWLCSVI